MADYETEVVSVDTGEPVKTETTPEAEKPKVEEEEVETTEETPEETTETTETEPEEETPDGEENLVTLPDGRKLPPKEAEAEYRNLYSEFTRKSQKLATYEKGQDKGQDGKIISNETEKKNEWIPQTWGEVLEKSKQALREDLDKEKQLEQEHRQQTEKQVLSQLEEVKKENPKLNETQLFNHALKYNFQDLKLAYQNMKDMQEIVKKTTETTAKNIQKRNADPISGGTEGGNVIDGDVYDPSAKNMSLVDYLHSIK